MEPHVVSAFYKFADLENPAALRSSLEERGRDLGILGTVLLAPEGINGTVAAGCTDLLDTFMNAIRSCEPLKDLEEKRSTASGEPFLRFKVRLKKEIVSLGEPEADPRKAVGAYVDPDEWDRLIQDPGVLLVDTRNTYETHIGRFPGAIDPGTSSFREFGPWARENLPPDRDEKIALYCTGGIRCEKATSLLRQMGYRKVYHLRGGILKYLETIPPEQTSWEGSCFVFDQRVGLGHGLRESGHVLCHGCRHPLSPDDLRDPRFEDGVQCPHCAASVSEERRQRLRERQRQVALAAREGRRHLGQQPDPSAGRPES
jgi:UPF0176 protein